MKTRILFLMAVGGFALALRAAEDFDQSVNRAALEYTERLRQATTELATTRERIAKERAPLLAEQRKAEDRLLAAESELTRLETSSEDTGNRRRRLIKDAEALHKNATYLTSLAQESLKGYTDSLAPGEDQVHGARLKELETAFGDDTAGGGTTAVAAADFLLERVRQSLGGYTAPGSAMVGDGNEVRPGTLAFVGPQSYFRAASGDAGVLARVREGSTYPVSFAVPEWTAAASTAFFQGGAGSVPADATGGKALRLKQTTGTVWQHIEKGGYVAFAILGVGCLSVLLMLQKLIDLLRLGVEREPVVRQFLGRVESGGRAAATPALAGLKSSTRELFATGLEFLDKPRAVLEENLQALLLRQRLQLERRLPLLAVIATAAPLMGLLGTVVGMVKTFALITVFGTGNAAKLASGISEVLVATELGLAVAIPTLVIHGFLSQRIHRNLAMQERYALQFVTVAKTGKEESLPV